MKELRAKIKYKDRNAFRIICIKLMTKSDFDDS